VSQSYGLIEMILVFGIVLAAAVFELFSLRRATRRAEDRERAARTPADRPE